MVNIHCQTIHTILKKKIYLSDKKYISKGTTGGIMAVAFIVDMLVWWKAGSINFVDEKERETGTSEEMTNLKSQDITQTGETDYL